MAEFFIRPDGIVEGVYTESIPLEKMLEELEIVRASECEYDNTDQCWYAQFRAEGDLSVLLPEGRNLERKSFERKSDAVAWEVDNLNRAFVVKHGL